MRAKQRRFRISVSEPLESRRLLSTYYVDANAPGTTQNGSSWEYAFKDLQNALVNKAVSGDTIKVADGTYKPTSSTDRTQSFILISGVGIYGGYAGYGATDPNARNIALYTTILSGDIGTVGTKTDNSYHVVTATSVSSTTVLDGVTVTLGYANGSGTNQKYGGGMLNLSSSSPTLNICVFTANCADSSGGGMYNSTSSPSLTNCGFTENIAAGGGGMYNISTYLTLTNCAFTRNIATNYGGGMYNGSYSPSLSNCGFTENTASYGGGMYNGLASPMLVNCAFTRNNASNSGGGMFNYTGSSPSLSNCGFTENTASNGGGMQNAGARPILANCEFIRNSASSQGGGMCLMNSSFPSLSNCGFTENTASNGGGLYNASYSSTLDNCAFTRNTASSNGGGMYNSNSYGSSMLILSNCDLTENSAPNGGGLYNASFLTLANCEFTRNTAYTCGGGIYDNSLSPQTLRNSTFAGNTASDTGGGMYNTGSQPNLTNCTFSGNAASGSGGGMYNSSSSPSLTNCIIWGNGSTPIYNSSSAPSITYTDIEGGDTGTGNLNSDPLFVTNPSPGPDSKWGTADDDYGDLRLQSSSPCVNKGLNSANTSPSDIAGNPRIINSTIDLGAYETLLPTPLNGTISDDSYVARLSADHSTLQIWTSPDTSGAPDYTYPLSAISAVALDLGAGNDTLLLDLSNGANIPLSLANIENIQILTTASNSLVLLNSQITLNSNVIPYASSPSFQLNSNILNSLALSGNVSLKLSANQLVIASGNVQTLQQYIFKGLAGTTPAILPHSPSTTLALLDNSRLHLTSFAGQTLASPFSQFLIQPATPGDANLDGIVNSEDLLNVYANLNKINTTWLDGDLNQNGSVTLADLAIVQSQLSAPSSLVFQKVQIKAKTTFPKKIHKHKPRHKPARKA